MCVMQLVEKQTNFSLKKKYFGGECLKQAWLVFCFFLHCSFLVVAYALVADACLNGEKKKHFNSILIT